VAEAPEPTCICIHVPRGSERGLTLHRNFYCHYLRMQLGEPGVRTLEGFTDAGYGLSSDVTRCRRRRGC
jgi:hypothetical protein